MGRYANFYNSRNKDRIYDADSMSEWLLPFFTSGVFNNCFSVTANNDMAVTVGGGYVNIKGKTKHFEQAQTFTLEKASGTLPRIDNVILRRDDTQRDFYVYVETGGFSRNPVAPEIVRSEAIYDLKLAEIYVGVGAIKITQEHIMDTRMNSDVCGWVMATVKEIDFSQITAQFQSYFNRYQANITQEFEGYMNEIADLENRGTEALEDMKSQFKSYSEEQQTAFLNWFNTIQNQLSQDAAGNLQSQCTALEERLSTLEKALLKSNFIETV